MPEDSPSDPVSKVQIDAAQDRIDQLNQDRPRPERTLEHTIDGTIEEEVHSEVNDTRNAEIDTEITQHKSEQERMQDFLDQRQGDAVRDFDQSR